MWIFSKHGFYSIVRASEQDLKHARTLADSIGRPFAQTGDEFAIRARVKGDLENLNTLFEEDPAAVRPIMSLAGRDYPYRIYASDTTVAITMQLFVQSLDYFNFKDEVARTQGYERAKLYSNVWGTMYEAEASIEKARKPR